MDPLRISRFLSSPDLRVDQRPAILDAFGELADNPIYTGLDFEGLMPSISGELLLTFALPGSKSIGNGGLSQLNDLPVTRITKLVGLTAHLDAIVVPDTNGISIGQHVSGPGIPRETYVTDKGDTIVTLSNPVYIGGTVDLTFTVFPYLINGLAMPRLRKLTIDNFTFDCNGRSAALRTPADSSGVLRLKDCRFPGFRDRGVTAPMTMDIQGCFGGSNEGPIAPKDRTSIFAFLGGDSKMSACQITDCLHTVITKSALLYQRNHNFQGHPTDNSRTAQLVLQGRTADMVLIGNAIDNSWIELTDEANAREGGSPLGWFIMNGNRCVVGPVPGTDIPDFAWLVVKPFSQNRMVRQIMATNNTFKNVAKDSFIDRFCRIDESMGTIQSPDAIVMENNIQNSIRYRTCTRPTITKDVTTASSQWDLDFSGLFPFGMTIKRIRSCEVLRQRDGWGSANYDRPYIKMGVVDGLAHDNMLRLLWPGKRIGTAFVSVDCSASDI